MVDEPRLLRLLDGITRDVLFLRSMSQRGADELLADEIAMAAIEFRFITTIEGVARAASHIVVSEGWGAPESNGAAIERLGEQKVIERPLAQRLRSAAGFRNVLVHQYADIDEALVVAALHELGDFDDFVSQVAAWARSAD